MEGCCPPAMDMLDLQSYTHKMSRSPSSLARMVSYNIVRCVRLPGVKGHSSINVHNWLFSLSKEYELVDLLLDATGNS